MHTRTDTQTHRHTDTHAHVRLTPLVAVPPRVTARARGRLCGSAGVLAAAARLRGRPETRQRCGAVVVVVVVVAFL